MNGRVLITGSSGLVGSALVSSLEERGVAVTRLDIKAHGRSQGDVRDGASVRSAIADVDGVIHLAAVSRVVWCERDPELCWGVNVGGLRNILQASAATRTRPWVVFASSREVYGQPDRLPATEDCPAQPVNVYGRSKVEGERLIEDARRAGLRACTIRLSNVYGSTSDHADRVVPAFARAAAFGQPLIVEGAENTFDFTHVDDVSQGIVSLAEFLNSKDTVPLPIQFVTETATTLNELATLAIRLADSRSTVRYAPPRSFDVARFVGSRARAADLLGWRPRTSLESGLAGLIRGFCSMSPAQESPGDGIGRRNGAGLD